jgi:signal transduction histidine kinase
MLGGFIISNRAEIIDRARARVALRTSPKPSDAELTNGIPVFLDQLVEALLLAKSSDVIAHEQIRKTAGQHGSDLLRMGLTIGQVVHDYGDICQVVTELAVQQKATISGAEFRTLNLCLDDAIAGAVTEFSRQRERSITDHGTERLGFLAHEQRNLLNTAMLAFDSIKSGRVGPSGSTAEVHARSLLGLRELIDRSLADVLLDSGIQRIERIPVAEFLAEVEIGATLQARSRSIQLTVLPADQTLAVEGDRQILAATVANLLQNAFKFTRKGGHVSLSAHATAEHVIIEIEDECGGLPPGKAEELFRPFEQRGADRSGVGLGLSICLKAAKAHGGKILVRDLPGKGCIFSLELPRERALPVVPRVSGAGPQGNGS